MKGELRFWLSLAVVALLGYILWWNSGRERARLREEVRALEQQLGSLQRDVGAAKWNAASHAGPLGVALLDRYIEQLGSDNVLVQYNAALSLKAMGSVAVPKLLEVVKEGNSRGRKAALAILGDIRDPESFRELRAVAKTHPASKTRAGALLILAKGKDKQSHQLFLDGVADKDPQVRGASLGGLRRLKSIEALPAVVARLDAEQSLLQKEVLKTILAIAQKAPSRFANKMAELSPKRRYDICKILGADNSEAASIILRRCLADQDQRVALTAVRILQKRGDVKAKEAAKRLVDEADNDEIKRIAEDLVQSFGKF